jgi:aquaporin Z
MAASAAGRNQPAADSDRARQDAQRFVARHEAGLRSLGRPNALVRQFDFTDDSYEWRRLFSEVFGTFLLVLVAAGGPIVEARFGHVVSTAALVVAPGLMVMAIILFMGAVSGAHLNPAVTIAFTLRTDFPLRRVPLYIVAQFLGAVLATLVVVALVGKQGTAGLTLPGHGISTVAAMIWEAVLTLGLVSVILGTASGAQQIGAMSAIAVGGYIALAGVIGAPVSGASMNPARSLGPALVIGDWTSWWAYLVGPLIGGGIAVGFAFVLRGRGGSDFGQRAAQGTLGTGWVPRRKQGAPESGGPQADGPQAAGPDAAGPDAAGPDAAGPDAAGPDAALPDAAGSGSAGPGSAGPDADGHKPAPPGSGDST